MLIKSKILNLRPVSVADADFIYNLRSSKGKFLNNDGFTEEGNLKWLKSLKPEDKSQFYFVISNYKEDVGVVRVYDINYDKKTFEWGSWVLKDNVPSTYAITSAMMLYYFAFEHLDLKKSVFEVRKENVKVNSFHKKTGATQVDCNDLDIYYEFEKEKYEKLYSRFHKIVGDIDLDEKK